MTSQKREDVSMSIVYLSTSCSAGVLAMVGSVGLRRYPLKKDNCR
jgi:hypothetical protein